MKVLVLVHADLVPPENIKSKTEWERAAWKTEYDVLRGLREVGYNVKVLGVYDDLEVIHDGVKDFKPRIIFNLLEEFAGEAVFDQNVVSYLEMLGIPYTGSNPRGLILSRDKALAKTILSYHKIPTAPFFVIPKNRKVTIPKNFNFPCFVKTVNEEASLGIDGNSIVKSAASLVKKVDELQKNFETAVLVENYIEGREFYVSLIGNQRIQVYPIWELYLDHIPQGHPKIASTRVKWDFDYRARYKVKTGPARNLTKSQQTEMESICKKAYRVLGLSGYARMDLRMDKEGNIFFLEANPNPDIGFKEDLSSSACHAGESYEELLSRIVRLGLSWEPTH